MSPRTDDLTTLQAQLAEKNDLVAALTSQLERTATQLDRLSRAGAERQGFSGHPAAPALSPDVTSKLTSALDEWQEFQPASRIERIESGIDRILDLLQSASHQQGSTSPASSTHTAPSHTPHAAEDFWAATKARLLGEAPPSLTLTQPESPRPAEHAPSGPVPQLATGENDTLLDFSDGPPSPDPIQDFDDPEELLSGIKSRDVYIQYLISRVRLAESKSYFPTDWSQIAHAPDRFRERLESLETVLKDHLRQAEVANSLERALLARERAKLSQIKQNLEIQIKKMAVGPVSPTSPPAVPKSPEPPEQKGDQESRWKRIFSR